MVDSGTQFVDEAAANTDSTITLLNTGQTVLQTQADHERDIRTFANDLADLTGTLRTSDKDIRTILQGGPPAVREVNSLLKGLEPTLPVFLSNLVTVNQVLVTNGLRSSRCWSSSHTSSPPASPAHRGEGSGPFNLQFNNNVPPCTKGYKPPSQWRPATDTSDAPVYPAKCKSGPPINMRGYNYAPKFGSSSSPGNSYRVSTYDARTGKVDTGNGQPTVVGQGAKPHAVFGEDGWKWMLTGPVTADD